MKNDYSFKLVAAIVIAGVFVALFSPNHGLHPVDAAGTDTVSAVAHTE